MHPTTIGPYRIERELGRGGMGEVFLARDTRLDRRVAIKTLPAHLAADSDRLSRFQREAKVLASLNHPGIGAIYGLEDADAHQYLILEFIEGETLADRLGSGAIPVDEALPIARQIAEALEAAHEKGVIHRDLKPANVMLTPDGVVKVLDFGLARTAEGSPSSTNSPIPQPDSPTVTTPMPVHSPTIPGAIMGTAGYMSPEQARGKAVDKRSDIFSFGCVLYEMLTGAGPFHGETVTDSLGAILHRQPDWSLLPPSTPARVRELLGDCLTKDRRNRLHDIGDARLELERAISGHDSATIVIAPSKRWMRFWTIPALAACAALLFGAGWLVATLLMPPTSAGRAQSFHVSATTPAKPELACIIGIAPDARFVVYRALQELDADSTKPAGLLVARRLDRDEVDVIEGTEGALNAALSADGRWMAFVAARDRAETKISLKKIALSDGRPTGLPETLCDLPLGGGFTLCWSSDREIIVAAGWQQTIFAVPATGGEARVVLKEDTKEVDVWGEIYPLVAGKSILASRWALLGQTIKERTEIVDLVTGKRAPLLPNAGGTRLVAGEYLVASRNLNALIAARFDLNTLQIIGDPVTVWSGALRETFAVSADGTLAMITNSGDISQRRLTWIDDQGQPQPIAASPRAHGYISISPDGNRVVSNLDSSDATEILSDLWIQDLSRRTFDRLPTNGASWGFVWSRDGQRIAYNTVSKDEFSIWNRLADGSGEPEKMYSGGSAQMLLYPTDWSPDGNILAILQVDLTKNAADVIMLEKDSSSGTWTATPYLNTSAGEDALRFSPDGKWVRFISDVLGRRELYVQPFSGAAAGATDARNGRRQISTTGAIGGGWWSQDGKEIRYIDTDRQLMSVDIQTGPNFSASLPKVLFSIKDLKTGDHAFGPDGRLMVVLQGDNERPNRIDLVVNFLDEIRSRMADAK